MHFLWEPLHNNDLLSLVKLAQNLLAKGPHKLEKTSRRVRALYDNLYIFDTTEYVHLKLRSFSLDHELVSTHVWIV